MDSRLKSVPFLHNFTDRAMQFLARVTPKVIPKRMRDFRDQYRHHLILKMRDGGIDEASTYLQDHFSSRDGDFFECDDREAKIAGLHRFAAAGAAVRYMAVHRTEVEDIIPLDIALRRNDRDLVRSSTTKDRRTNCSQTVLRAFHVPRAASGLRRQKGLRRESAESCDV